MILRFCQAQLYVVCCYGQIGQLSWTCHSVVYVIIYYIIVVNYYYYYYVVQGGCFLADASRLFAIACSSTAENNVMIVGDVFMTERVNAGFHYTSMTLRKRSSSLHLFTFKSILIAS